MVDRVYPPAIREDRNPFAFMAFIPGFERLLIFVRWTSYQCPSCGKVFRRDFWPSNTKLGPAVRTCANCGVTFDDGSREWPELPFPRKVRILFPPLLQGICGGFVLAGILVSTFPDHDWRVTVFSLTIGLLPAVTWGILRLPWVLFSIRRYNNREQQHSP